VCNRSLKTSITHEIVRGNLDHSVLTFADVASVGWVKFGLDDQFVANDALVYDSGRMQGRGKARQIDVPLGGVQRLRLVVTDAADGFTSECRAFRASLGSS